MSARRSSGTPYAGIIGIVVMLVLMYVLFKMVSGVFAILSIAAPILFIISMFMNFSVVKDYFLNIIGYFKTDLPKGLMYAGATFFLFPLVAAFLFFKAFTTRGLKKQQQQKAKGRRKGEDYVKYEEVAEDDDFLELEDLGEDIPDTPVVKKAMPKEEPLNRYDDLFS